MTMDEIKALLDAFKQAAKYNPSGNVAVGRAAEDSARDALLQAVEEVVGERDEALRGMGGALYDLEAARSTLSTLRAERDRLLAERDAANETARRIAAEREAVRVAATKCVEDVRAIGQRYRDDWADFDGRTLKEELIEATWGLDRALSSSPRAESEGPTNPRRLFRYCPGTSHPMAPSYCATTPHDKCDGCDEPLLPAEPASPAPKKED